MLNVVVCIGCIECGVDSMVVGVYSSKERADKECERAIEVMIDIYDSQHSIEVLTCSGLDTEPNHKREG